MYKERYRTVLFLVFTISGFTGLIYESIWTHYLKLFLGHAAYAQTLVLSIFMGGMAMGSWICSTSSARWRNLLLLYAVAEGAIGLFALLFHEIFLQAVSISHSTILPHLGTPLAANTFKWTLSASLILPETMLLGMTFPLMSAGILRAFPETPGRSISLLYFTNSLGAAIGVLVSGFVLIKTVGLPGTIRIAGLINLAIAGIVWFLSKGHPSVILPAKMAPSPAQTSSDDGWYRFLLIASFVTGMASFIYEIGWIRMLSLVLGSSTHAFELMLSAFIFGLAFGGLWIQRRIDGIAHPILFLVKVQAFMSLLAVSTLFFYGHLFGPMQWIVRNIPKTDMGYAIFNLSSNAIALAIMLPTTFCAGMTLPLITYVLLRRGHGEKSIGAVYAANTLGAIVGVFSAVHFGMPLLGLKGLITVGAGFDLILAVALLWGASKTSAKDRRTIYLTAACICAIALNTFFVQLDPYKMASGVYRDGTLESSSSTRLLYHRDGKTSTVSAFLYPDGGISIRTNGKADAKIQMNQQMSETSDEPTMVLAAVIPMALNPHAKKVANIGFGSGLTTATLLLNDALEEVVTVEIEPAMIEGAKIFGDRVRLAYTDQRSKIYVDDAKTFFSVQQKKYDIIISEPSNPWVSGVASLFSREFYQLASNHLEKNGLFCQWLQIYEMDMALVASVLKAISSSFSDYVVYAANYNDLIIVASNDNSIPQLDAEVFSAPELARALKRIRVRNIQDIELRKVGNRKILDPFTATFPIPQNSDYFPVLDQNAVRARFLQKNASAILTFTHSPLPALEILSESGYTWLRTDVTPSNHYPQAKEAFIAMALRDYFHEGQFSYKYSEIPPDVIREASDLRLLASRECQEGQGLQGLKAGLYHVVVLRMTPYLRPGEMEGVWSALESGPCFKSLPPRENKWIALFKAVGRRDVKTMADIAGDLLANEPNIQPGIKKYVVAAGMMGNLTQGAREKSFRIWDAYLSSTYGKRKPELLFRLLLADSTRTDS